MQDFARLYAQLDATTSTSAKVDAMVGYLAKADARDAAWAVYFLAGGKPRQVVPMSQLAQAAAREAGLAPWLFEESYQAVGDLAEMRAIRKVFGREMPPISSTKSLSGHALGAAGVHEAIYCMLMMRENFIAGSANIDNLDPELTDMPVLREARSGVNLNTVMSNSFGFGGTNATLVLKRWEG